MTLTNRWLLLLAALYAVFALVALTSGDIRYYAVEGIAELFWYHNTAYYAVYILSPLVLIALLAVRSNQVLSTLFVFVCSFVVAELIVRRLYSIYHHSLTDVAGYVGWILSFLLVLLLLFLAARKSASTSQVQVFLASTFAVILSFTPHILYLMRSISEMPS